MSRSLSPRIENQNLKVQELVINKDQDVNLYVVSGLDLIIFCDEAVKQVKCVVHVDDSLVNAAAIASVGISVVDSTAYTAGGDLKAIKLANFTFAANDSLIIKYELVK